MTEKGKVEQRKRYDLIKWSNMNWAKSQVYKSVRARLIAPASWLSCKDCGSQAEVYDHRDYHKPLEIEPVCKACNFKRGPGLNRD